MARLVIRGGNKIGGTFRPLGNKNAALPMLAACVLTDGAAPDCWFSHLAVEVPGEGTSNEWCEPVAEKTYGILR